MLGPSAVILLEGKKKKKGPGQNVQKEVKFNKKNKKPQKKKHKTFCVFGRLYYQGLGGKRVRKAEPPFLNPVLTCKLPKHPKEGENGYLLIT